ncbi:class A beta-lactamase [Burkholderia pseudomultivorans]|uniref:beta-lactamase n=2 Tax=Burkholderia cepacia complex TaxID=87882 RepID=A0AAN0RWA2_9BURK|nr:class A beta-lactamase [Burkholderia pseudomultivorans]AIO34794.1 beta-lactamase OXY-2 [Burkholderia cenocepacia]AOI88214.1 class A beta-lactamase [Burkholderia pseudomultivorans]KVC25363.1 class A beta-lactamase [Burkholderia pseudomultivorans]KVC27638.1 class A beta-lactamase [Burkholderia pseudomultivorans]KVC41474.1 class A beta-lactamase [Burkholderia pseudomultivorans]
MDHSSTRRSLLLAAVAAPFVAACAPAPVADQGRVHAAQSDLAALEKASNGRLGVAALDTSNGARVAHHARERFPLCGTYAVVAAAAVLARGSLDATLLPRRILYRRYDVVAGSPVTENHVDTGMTIAQLCAAMLQSGDKGAGNLLMGVLGGPQAVTSFAHESGDTTFRLDHWEPELNAAAPGDERDTSTPVAMVDMLQRLLLGDTLLREPQRAQLIEWMVGGARGAAGIAAGVPPGWRVADKAGTGRYGTTSDVAVVWPPSRAPLVMAVSFTQPRADAAARADVVASAARIVANALATTA